MSPAIAIAIGSIVCAQAGGEWELTVGMPCRVHLRGPDGKPVKAPGLPFFNDHFVCEGLVKLRLPAGTHEYTVERGPDCSRAAGKVEIKDGAAASTSVKLAYIVRLELEGWFAGDVHVHRLPDEMPLHLRAEGLSIAPVITVWNQGNLWKGRPLPEVPLIQLPNGAAYHVLGCEDERQGGALLYFNLSKPLDFTGAGPELPSPTRYLSEAAAQPGAWIDIEKPFWWDVPVWLASGKVRSIGIANNHMCRSKMYEDEAWGRPRDAARLPPPRGNGFYTQELYYRILNCGFRIPPSAGSASGVLPNPVGYNRVYVHVAQKLTWEGWWEGLGVGRSFITNGPILLVDANGKLPGEAFRFEKAADARLDLSTRIFSNDAIEAIEVIRDGEVIERVEGADVKPDSTGRVSLKPVRFERSGWIIVRAIAKVPETFRFASTAPFYVEVAGHRSTVHREDVEFFIRWIDERTARLEKSKDLKTPEGRAQVIGPQRAARQCFEAMLPGAN